MKDYLLRKQRIDGAQHFEAPNTIDLVAPSWLTMVRRDEASS